MAYAMMGGIIVGTVLTLLFLPALYVTWFRIMEPSVFHHPRETSPALSGKRGESGAEKVLRQPA